eukprot:TRINITY_DN6553_c0_g1_i1.p1 TRINITY_DN6553_c0_g1~~TRINITY_DN6553_c0_g1_i1.p1  ORF type:complete len:306 (+),score=25.22 TRINITY_DN6553_c0_g1_i1:54-971(+)
MTLQAPFFNPYLNPYQYPNGLFLTFYGALIAFILVIFLYDNSLLNVYILSRDATSGCYWYLTIHIIFWIPHMIIGSVNSYFYEEQFRPLSVTSDALLIISQAAHASLMFLLPATLIPLLNHALEEDSREPPAGKVVFPKRGRFGSPLEVFLYEAYAVLQFFVYPIVQWFFFYDELEFRVIPQLVYFGQLMFSVLIFVLLQMRLLPYYFKYYSEAKKRYRGTVIEIVIGGLGLLILWNLGIAIPLTILNIFNLCKYVTPPVVPSILIAIYQACYFPMIITVAFMLNLKDSALMLTRIYASKSSIGD